VDELHLALGHAAGHRDHGRAELLGAVVRAQAAGEKAVAVRDVDDVALRPPAARIERAITVDHVSMSFAVYPTTVGFPVVPDDAWMRTICSRGTANIPNG
jgi:hypothetical protein